MKNSKTKITESESLILSTILINVFLWAYIIVDFFKFNNTSFVLITVSLLIMASVAKFGSIVKAED